MQKDIHPEVYDVVFVDINTGDEFIAQSVLKSEETKTINKKKYFVIKVETSSASHPFYTGKQKTLKTGRVDKYMKLMEKAQKRAETKVKKVKKGSESKVAEESADDDDE